MLVHVQMVQQTRAQIQAVAAAATSGDAAALGALKAQGVSLTAVGRTALEPMVEALREGQEVEALREGKVVEAKAMWGALSEMGAKLDATDTQGCTAFILAVKNNDVLIARVLHELGADVDRMDVDGKTAGDSTDLYEETKALLAELGARDGVSNVANSNQNL